MRLTLRTLLAYLDGILDANDTGEIKKKIGESEFATGLVRRIRDVVHRLRLGTPSLPEPGHELKGLGLDPNTVAEYLDNTLAADQVTDFEKVCLDSDIFLAEVASCHQVLTLVLGEPAEVEPESRQRIYQLKNVATGGKTPPPPPSSNPGAAPPIAVPLSLDLGDDDLDSHKSRTKPTVPEYLREPRRRPVWIPVLAMVFIAICVIAAVLKTLGVFEPSKTGESSVAKTDVAATAAATSSTATHSADDKNADDATAKNGNSSEPPASPLAGTQSSQSSAASSPTALATAASATTGTAVNASAPAATASATTTSKELDKPQTSAAAAGTVPTIPGVTPSSDAAKPTAASQGTAPVVATIPPGGVPTPGGTNVVETKPTEVASAAASNSLKGAKGLTPPAPMKLAEPLGQLRSSDQILLAMDASGDWIRVTANQFLLAQQLMVLPTYRAKIEMTRGVEASILGDTRIELLNAEMPKPLGIRIFYGRIVIRPLAKPGSQVQLAFGDHVGVLKFAEADSTVALEVRRVHMPGANPETEPLRVMADMYATIDDSTWTEIVDGKPVEPVALKPRHRLNFDSQTVSEPIAAKETPSWIVAEPLSELDRRASAAVADVLPTDRAARDGLLESALSRPQREVKWLALRCLSCVGNFSDVVTALNDPNYRLSWPDYIDLLRASVARDAESAAAVRADLEKQYPGQSEELYEMLWGYTDPKLAAGADAKLVRDLDSDKLAVRVLAIWNLKNITNLGGEYRPEYAQVKRQPLTQRWWKRLENKEIRFEPEAGGKSSESRKGLSPSSSSKKGPPKKAAAILPADSDN